MSAGAVAKGGDVHEEGERKRERIKRMATVIAVRPVRPPSRDTCCTFDIGRGGGDAEDSACGGGYGVCHEARP